MTPSPTPSSKSSPSSRPSSSTSNSVVKGNRTPLPPFRPDFHPLQHFSGPRTHEMGVAGPSRLPITSGAYASPQERLGDPRQMSDESIPPHPSVFAPQEADTGAGHDTGASDSPSTEQARSKQKKKRTRTLTTPHQSAVLHALLAQSRFPTTAMREEVGRSIGLSARKVQVWFQNQRQKARKPRNQSTVPLNRPPQFGPFMSSSDSERASLPVPSGPPAPFRSDNPSNVHPHQIYHSDQLQGPAPGSRMPTAYTDAPKHPLPNVIGHPSPQNPSFVTQQFQYPSLGHIVDPGPSSSTRSLPSSFSFASSPSQGPQFGPQVPFPSDPYDRPVRSVPEASMIRGSEPPIVLPPLRFNQRHASQMIPQPQIHHPDSHLDLDTSRHSGLSSHSGPPASSSAPHFGSSVTLPPPPSRHSKSIPPPFTLQPQPQWSSSTPIMGPSPAIPPPLAVSQGSRSSSPVIRPRYHRTQSDPTQRLPPLSTLLDQERPQDRPLITQPLTQPNFPSNVGMGGRRFDPVHSAVREGGGHGGGTVGEGGNATRPYRHTHDFTMHSGNVGTPSPPNSDDGHAELHRLNNKLKG